ncbi:hypothetical protein EIP91_010497 [Steccherinum ochraceum]|uniref:Uncharacterized protein n=1 Tax=Steccherinum ochraceum TaxID=92696 RepID=A0A4R0RN13_9APHY|nr:hypothetical protein EIP91_010497 [Steccherinum ochraceum]
MQVDERQTNGQPADPSPSALPDDWQAQLVQLRSANELLQRQKADAEKDRELFRDMYSKASTHAGEVIKENNALEERATVLETQVRDGITMIRSTYEVRVAKLEEEVKRWRGMYEMLQTRDERANGEELRQKAAMEGQLRLENAALREDMELLRDDYEKMEKVLEQLGEQELEQFGEQEEELKHTVATEANLAGAGLMVTS